MCCGNMHGQAISTGASLLPDSAQRGWQYSQPAGLQLQRPQWDRRQRRDGHLFAGRQQWSQA
jgi:hypothetical protein